MVIKTHSPNFIRIYKHEFEYKDPANPDSVAKKYVIDCSVCKQDDKLWFGYVPTAVLGTNPLKLHIWVGEVNKENKNIRAPKEVYGAAIELFKKFGKELGYEEGNLVFAETQ